MSLSTVPVKNLSHGHFSPFGNLKVFYQILIVIVIMMAFLISEGIMGINNISEMQLRSQEIVSKGINGMDSLFNYKIAVEHLRRVYSEALLRKHQGLVSFTLAEIRMPLENIDPTDDDRKMLNGYIDKIGTVLERPVSEENWKEIEQYITLIGLNVQTLDQETRSHITDLVELGTQFAASSKMYTIIFVIVSLAISLLLGILITASISKPLAAVVKASRMLAKGDFSQNVAAKGCWESVQAIGSLQEAINSLRRLVFDIHEHSQMLFVAGKELNTAASDTGTSAVEVAKAMEELSKASSEQSNEVMNTVLNVHELSELVQKVSSDTAEIAYSSGKIADSAQVGQQVAVEAAQEINDLYKATQVVANIINEVNQSSNEINRITTIIEAIAEQTSLLALNAAIEAARAGENGKGFSVVANETGKLAEQSKQAAKTIANMLVVIQQRSGQAVKVIEDGITKAETGRELTHKAKVAFDEIFAMLDNILFQIRKVAGSAKQMAEKNEKVTGAISNISAISEETMASTEEVSATAEQQTASVEEVSALADNLLLVASKLKESVAVFRI